MTEYRIIPHKTIVADYYLQFKTTETITTVRRKGRWSWLGFGEKETITETKEVWRFVPEVIIARVLGKCLAPESCPTELLAHCSSYVHCFHGLQGQLKGFAKIYPDISVYFDKLKRERAQYLAEKEVISEAKVEYL